MIEVEQPGGRDRPVRRPDAAEARAGPGRRGRAAARHAGRVDPPGRGPAQLRRAARRARPQGRRRTRPPSRAERGARGGRRGRLPAAGPPVATCSAAGRWRSATRATALADYLERTQRARRRRRSSSTASSRTRSRSTSTRSATASTVQIGAIMQHVEEAGVHSGDSACVIPAMSLGAGDARPGRAGHRGDRAAARRGRPDQHPVRRLRRRGAVRDRGQPARLAHGAVRLEGDRRAAGEGRLPADARRAPGGHASSSIPRAPRHVSVKEAVLPFGRFPRADALLGPGDEVHRRGDGRRGRLPGRVRQGPGRRGRGAARARARCSSRVTDGDKPAATQLAAALHDLGFHVLATGGTAQAIRRMGVPVERHHQAVARARRTWSTGSSPARSTW